MEMTSLSKSTIYRREKSGEFPKRLFLGGNCVVWKSIEIDWGDIKSSWEEDWNAATHIKGNVHPWDATYIEDESRNEIEKESSK